MDFLTPNCDFSQKYSKQCLPFLGSNSLTFLTLDQGMKRSHFKNQWIHNHNKGFSVEVSYFIRFAKSKSHPMKSSMWVDKQLRWWRVIKVSGKRWSSFLTSIRIICGYKIWWIKRWYWHMIPMQWKCINPI